MISWRLLRSGGAPGAYNMAVDEAILRCLVAGRSSPTIRLYRFQPPCLSLGYFQSLSDDVDLETCRSLGVELVRRPTGGRAVFHDGELTYSVIGSYDGEVFPTGVLPTYQKISRCLARALSSVGVETKLTPLREKRSKVSSKTTDVADCFSSSSWYELTAGGAKIVGSAQRRERNFFLQHGSIMVNLDRERYCKVFHIDGQQPCPVTSVNEQAPVPVSLIQLEEALISAFEDELGIPLREDRLTDEESRLAERLRGERYTCLRWKQCR